MLLPLRAVPSSAEFNFLQIHSTPSGNGAGKLQTGQSSEHDNRTNSQGIRSRYVLGIIDMPDERLERLNKPQL